VARIKDIAVTSLLFLALAAGWLTLCVLWIWVTSGTLVFIYG
jgi:hypothetical protein